MGKKESGGDTLLQHDIHIVMHGVTLMTRPISFNIYKLCNSNLSSGCLMGRQQRDLSVCTVDLIGSLNQSQQNHCST